MYSELNNTVSISCEFEPGRYCLNCGLFQAVFELAGGSNSPLVVPDGGFVLTLRCGATGDVIGRTWTIEPSQSVVSDLLTKLFRD